MQTLPIPSHFEDGRNISFESAARQAIELQLISPVLWVVGKSLEVIGRLPELDIAFVESVKQSLFEPRTLNRTGSRQHAAHGLHPS